MFAISRHGSARVGFLFRQIPSLTIFPRNLGPNFRQYLGDGQNKMNNKTIKTCHQQTNQNKKEE
jgi:hypothetical protein